MNEDMVLVCWSLNWLIKKYYEVDILLLTTFSVGFLFFCFCLNEVDKICWFITVPKILSF